MDTTTTTTNLEIDKDQIRTLRYEAGCHGDEATVETCQRALRGDVDALQTVADILAEAISQDC